MEVITLLLFFSLVLAAAGVGFFLWNTKSRNHDYADQLAILPLEEDHEKTQTNSHKQ